ncbi:MAG TPA: hypothetical protein VM864_01210 [Pyrinomonadaceae bacterium]|jgi:hypothetical protein|nr:hypothetical protein [Pyrinomonadaceae bacterium]
MQNNPPPNYQPTGQPFGQPPKKSKAPWIIAGALGCLVLVVVVIALFGGLAYLGLKKAGEVAESVNANGGGGGTRPANRPANRPAPAPPSSSATAHYANSREGRTGNLEKYYVGFSFDYPGTWKLDPDPAPSYVRVERMTPDDLTTENFSVGWVGATGNAQGNTEFLSKMVNQLADQISPNFPGFEKASEGATTINSYEGYELRFQRDESQSRAGQLPYWGRIVVLLDEDDPKRGVALIMLATSKAQGVEGVDDVGVKGELRGILDSFRLESSQ